MSNSGRSNPANSAPFSLRLTHDKKHSSASKRQEWSDKVMIIFFFGRPDPRDHVPRTSEAADAHLRQQQQVAEWRTSGGPVCRQSQINVTRALFRCTLAPTTGSLKRPESQLSTGAHVGSAGL